MMLHTYRVHSKLHTSVRYPYNFYLDTMKLGRPTWIRYSECNVKNLEDETLYLLPQNSPLKLRLEILMVYCTDRPVFDWYLFESVSLF